MPYAGALRIGSRRFLAALAIGILFVACIPQRAEAQAQYSFTFAGPTVGTAGFVGLIIEATNSGSIYTATGNNFSGTYGGQTITSISGNWGWSGVDGTVAIFSISPVANPNPSLSFTTSGGVTSGSAMGDTQFNLNATSISGSWDVDIVDGTGLTASSNTTSGSVTVALVPGPLAGAGMLSWLAVMVMGLAWRRQWLMAKARTWLAARRLRGAQVA